MSLEENEKIDFTKYSCADLDDAYKSIDQESYPDNFAACVTEIKKRHANGTWKLRTLWDWVEEHKEFLTKLTAWLSLCSGTLLVLFYIFKFIEQLSLNMLYLNTLMIIPSSLFLLGGSGLMKNKPISITLLQIATVFQVFSFGTSGIIYQYFFGPSVTFVLSWTPDIKATIGLDLGFTDGFQVLDPSHTVFKVNAWAIFMFHYLRELQRVVFPKKIISA